MPNDDIKRVTTGESRDEQGRFVEGVSGNPNGRPPGSGISITTEIRRKLAEVPQGQKASYLELLIARIMKQAIQDGDQQMITRIWNYIDGMPAQAMDITSAGEKLASPSVIIDTNGSNRSEPDKTDDTRGISG